MKLASFTAIVRALNAGQVRFLVVGGIAVNAHGHGRTTYDVDLVIQLEPGNILRAFAALDPIGYRPLVPITAAQFADRATRDSWREEKGMVVLQFHSDQHRETRLDVFVSEPFDFDHEYQAAYRDEISPGIPVCIVRLETLIAMKTLADRDRDRDDIQHLRWTEEERRHGH